MPGRKVVIEFLGKDRSFGKTAGDMAGHSGRLTATLGKLGGAFAGLAVISKTTDFLKDSVAEARESQKVNAQTAAVIKSTGGAAKVTAKEFGSLATAISNKTGIDDEQIQAGENMLATFTNVQNRMGKGNDIFTQATRTAIDFGVATKKGPTAASLALGKALNDPLTGLTKLTKVGVNFSDQQRAQVAQMLKVGNVAGAQKVILKELNKEFGGSAAAQATAGERAAIAWANLKESVGTAMLPVLDKVFNALSQKVIPALYQIPPIVAKVRAFIAPLIDHFRTLGNSGGEAGSKFAQFRQTFTSVFASVQQIIQSTVSIVTSLWNAFGQTIMSFASVTLTNLMTSIRGAFTVIQGIFQVFSSLLKGDWAGVWQGIKQILSGAVTVLKAAVAQLWNVLRAAFTAGGIAIKAIFSGMWSGIKSLAAAGLGQIVAAVRALPGRLAALGGLLKSAGKGVLTSILNGLKGAGGFAADFASSIWGSIKSAINGGIDRLNSLLDFSVKIGPKRIPIHAPTIGHLATGTDNWRGGPTWVGERGPEILDLPAGSRVIPNNRVAAAIGAKSSGGDLQPVIVKFFLDGKMIQESLLKLKRSDSVPLGLA